MADVQIRFRAQGSEAKREINQLTKEIQELRRGMEQTQRTSTQPSPNRNWKVNRTRKLTSSFTLVYHKRSRWLQELTAFVHIDFRWGNGEVPDWTEIRYLGLESGLNFGGQYRFNYPVPF